jgi:phospholipid/cholesterol/gamma-HCH transport system substrate-binding protein
MFIIGFSYLKGNHVFISDRTFYAIYNDVEGISKGTPVTISGFNVGSIQNIEFFNDSEKLLVKFRVENKINFSKNSIAQIYETGLIGGKALAVITKPGIVAKSGDTLSSAIAPGLTELVNDKLSPLQEKIESTFVSADSLLIAINNILDNQTQSNIKNTFEDLSETVENVKFSTSKFENLLEENENKISNIINRIDITSSNLSNFSNSFADLEKTIENFSKTSENLNLILSEISSGNGTFNKLIFDDSIVNSLNSASENINLLLEDLRLNPKRYVHFSLFGKKNKPYEKSDE